MCFPFTYDCKYSFLQFFAENVSCYNTLIHNVRHTYNIPTYIMYIYIHRYNVRVGRYIKEINIFGGLVISSICTLDVGPLLREVNLSSCVSSDQWRISRRVFADSCLDAGL